MIIIRKVDSFVTVSSKMIEFSISRLGKLLNKLYTTPVFLVNEHTIDQFYPDRLRYCLSEECLREKLKEIADRGTESRDPINAEDIEQLAAELEDFWKSLEECRQGPCWYRAQPMGLYIADLSKFDEGLKQELTYPRELDDSIDLEINGDLRMVTKGPAILICPERIVSWVNSVQYSALEESDRLKFGFHHVLAHELVHAHLQTSPSVYSTPWGRLIEESLAEAYSLSLIDQAQKTSSRSDRTYPETESGEWESLIAQAIGLQAFEYRACTYWRDIPPRSWNETVEQWREFLIYEEHWPFAILTGAGKEKIRGIHIALGEGKIKGRTGSSVYWQEIARQMIDQLV